MSALQKTYRIPFKKAITYGSIGVFIVSLIFLSAAISLTLYALAHTQNIFITPWWAHLIVVTFILELWILGLMFYQTFCYLVLYDDKMVIKNIFLPRYSKTIYFRDLIDVKTVRIFTHSHATKSPYSTRAIATYKKGKKYPEPFGYWYLRLVNKSD